MALTPQQYHDLFVGFQNAPDPQNGGPTNLLDYVAKYQPGMLQDYQQTVAQKPAGDYSMGPNGWQPTQHMGGGSLGSLLGGMVAPLAVAAAPFAIGAMTGNLGSGGLGAFTGTAAPTAATASAAPTVAGAAAPAAASGTGLIPGSTVGLTAPAAPSLASMGGGIGVTAPAYGGGTLAAGGVVPADFGASMLAPSLTAGGAAATGLSGAGGVSNTGSAVAPSGGSASGTPLSRVLDGTATSADYLSLAGSAAPAALGVIASNNQANAQQGLSNQLLSYGGPSRQRFEASFSPGFSMTNDPGYQDALDAVTKAMLHKLSVTGNPSGNPNAMQQILQDVNSQFAYPALQQYRQLNAGTGAISGLQGMAPGMANAAINSNANVYNSIGAGAADIFNPPSSLDQLLKQLKTYGH